MKLLTIKNILISLLTIFIVVCLSAVLVDAILHGAKI